MTYPAQAESPDSDAQLAAEAIGFELAAADLYDAAVSAGADDLWATLREQHESFAERLSGLIGTAARGASADFAAGFQAGFDAADPAVAAELENTLAAQYVAKLGSVSTGNAGSQIAGAFASILTSESRHAVLLSGVAGVTDLEAVYVNPVSEA